MNQTMTQWDAFLQAICENPEDDSVRLIAADWLEENAWRVADGKARKGTTLAGEEAEVQGESTVLARAEYIRCQVELAQLNVDDYAITYWDGQLGNGPEYYRRAKALRRRERDLLDTLCRRGLEIGGGYTVALTAGYSTPEHPLWKLFPPGGGPEIANVEFRRGFVANVSLTCADFAGGTCPQCSGGIPSIVRSAGGEWSCPTCNGTGRTPGHAGSLFRAAPIERVTLTDRQPVFIRMSTHGASFWRWFDGSRYLRSGDERTYIDFPADIDPDELPGSLWKVYDGLIEAQEEVTWEHRSKEEALQWLSAACVKYGRAAAKGGA